MNISYRWLQDLVPGLELAPQELADRLAMQGAPVEEIADIGAKLGDVVIARVEHADRHPNADRLRLCRVDAGTGELLQVVCGAPNVVAGRYYPFAPVGARLPHDVIIRKAKIRGAESQGMLCSPRELELGRDHDGLLELHGEFEPGSRFIEAVGLDDARLEVEVTPNRPDLLSHLGVAREVGAIIGRPARLHRLPGAPTLPDIEVVGDGEAEASAGGIAVAIEAPELCSRYYGLVIRGVRVASSPEWLASRLRTIGLRPISNVVDATNWVLHELGQPLHAFDLARLGERVVVRRARAGERITTLDGVDRPLTADMLVIADASRPVAVAGVMGGADTEVQGDTTDILLECAHFDPGSVRATRRTLGLSTDASYRFERGVDADLMLTAVRRAAELIVATAGGTVEARVAAPGTGLPPIPPVTLRLARIEQVLGRAFTVGEVTALLEPLGYAVHGEREDAVRVAIPTHRRYDVAREEDLIEDIARRFGYESFSDELRPYRPTAVPDHPLFGIEDRLRDLLVRRGFMEAHTAAFVPESDGDVALLHPLAATESRLRRALLPGLLRRVEYNFARGARSIRLFELGTAFAPGHGGDPMPRESLHLGIVFTGLRRPPHFTTPAEPFDVWDLKDVAEGVGRALGLAVEPAPDAVDPASPVEAGLSFRFVDAHNGAERGRAGRIHARRIDAPAWADDVWGLEVEVVPAHAGRPLRFREPPSFPGTERDLALFVPDDLAAAAVTDAIRQAGGTLLEDVTPFDVYAGSGVPAGVRSIAFRIRFRAADRTLTDDEVDAVVNRILKRLGSEHGVQQRT